MKLVQNMAQIQAQNKAYTTLYSVYKTIEKMEKHTTINSS